MKRALMMKLIAVIMVLMLSLCNLLALVSYAAEISLDSSVDLESQDSKTNNKNVEFDSYMIVDNNKSYEASFNVEEQNKVYVHLNLSKSGYLKTGSINFDENTFNIKKQDELGSTIQSIDYDKNEIILNQVNGGTEIELQIPIEIAKNEVFNLQNLNKNNKVVFKGTYITEKGKEKYLEKEIFLNINWNTNAEPILEQGVSKYINNIDDMSLIELNLKSALEQNALPVKETNVEIVVPEIEGKMPKYVNVVADRMLSTIGKTHGIEFDENNFEYNEEEKKVKINVQNLQNEQGQVAWTQGFDEYNLVLVYDKLEEFENKVVFNTKTSLDIYGKSQKLEKTITSEVVLNEEIGNTNEINITSDTEDIYKSFMYANSEYETEYKVNWNLDIGYSKVSDKVTISDIAESFVGENGDKVDANKNTYYKQTIINKKNFEKILGAEGFVKILNEANEEIAFVTAQSSETEDIVINYQNTDLNKIKIETSKPQKEGILEFKHIKAIKSQTDFEKEEIKSFVRLENEINLNTIYSKVIKDINEQEVIEDTNIININVANSINLIEPKTKIGVELNKESIVTGSVNEDVEIYINLINNKEEYKLFENPTFDIRLPEELEHIQIKDVRLVFEEELVIQNTQIIEAEDGTKYIRISLNGTQTKYNIGNIITGGSLIITADIGLKDIEETKQAEIEVICTNDEYISNVKTVLNLIKVEIPEEEEEEQPEIQPDNPEEEQPETQPENPEEEQPEEEHENPEEIPEEDVNEKEQQEEDNLSVTAKVSSNKENEELKWGEIVTYKVNVKNYGENLTNSKIVINLPEGLTYMAEEDAFEPLFYEPNEEVKTIIWNLEELLIGRELEKEFKALVNKDVENIAINAQIIDDNTGKIVTTNTLSNNCKKGNVSIQLENNLKGLNIGVEDTFNYQIKIKEILGENLTNLNLELPLPNGINYLDSYIIAGTNVIRGNTSTDNNIVKIKIDELSAFEEKHIVVEVDAKNILENEDREINAQVKINADGIEEFTSNISNNRLSKPKLEVKEYTNLENNEAQSGKIIKHIIEIKNVGTGIAENVEIKDNFTDGLSYLNTVYTKDGKLVENKNYDGTKSRITTSLEENETLIAVVTMEAKDLSSNVENFVEVSANGIETITTEKDVYKIKTNNNTNNNQGNNEQNNNQNNNNQPNSNSKSNVSGTIWVDKNKNGIKELEEEKVKKAEVYLINTETQTQLFVNTDSEGKFSFDSENGKYMIVAVYDDEKYSLTKVNVNYADTDMTSKGLRAEAVINNQQKVVAIIENVNVQNTDISNLNIGLVENDIFDLSLNKVVESVEVMTKKGTTMYNSNQKFAKVEIHAKEIEGAKVKIKYRFDIKNEGDIEGSAKKIVENIPEGLNINLDENPGWKIDEKGNLYNDTLANQTITTGETKSVYLVLTKDMTEDNTGIINNIAEIGESYNKLGIKDTDSINGNNNKNEDDLSNADVYIGIKTGRTVLYISLGLSMLIVLSTGIYLINKKVLQY